MHSFTHRLYWISSCWFLVFSIEPLYLCSWGHPCGWLSDSKLLFCLSFLPTKQIEPNTSAPCSKSCVTRHSGSQGAMDNAWQGGTSFWPRNTSFDLSVLVWRCYLLVGNLGNHSDSISSSAFTWGQLDHFPALKVLGLVKRWCTWKWRPITVWGLGNTENVTPPTLESLLGSDPDLLPIFFPAHGHWLLF